MFDLQKREANDHELRDLNLEIRTEEPKYTKPWWWEDIKEGHKGDIGIRNIVKSFVLGTFNGKKTAYGGRHVYSVKNEKLWLYKKGAANKVRICVAKKVGEYFIGNSSALTLQVTIAGKKSWVNAGQFKIQRILGEVMPMVPFRMFKETRLDLNSMNVIDKTPDEKFDVVAVTGSIEDFDPRFVDALNPGGRLFVVVGTGHAMDARLVMRTGDNDWQSESLFETVLAPLVNGSKPPQFLF